MSRAQTLLVALATIFIVGLAIFFSDGPVRVPPSPTIGVVLPSETNQFWIEVRRGAEKAQFDLGTAYEIIVRASSDQDAASQSEILTRFHARGQIAAIVLGPASGSAVIPSLASFAADGVPIVVIDTKLDADLLQQHEVGIVSFIGSNNRIGGELAAKAMAFALRDKTASVLQIKGSFVHQSAIDRFEGFTNTGEALGLEITSVDGLWKRARAQQLVEAKFRRQRYEGIFAANDDMALGAIQALKLLNLRTDEWPIVIGFDATTDGLEAIADGNMYATLRQDARKMGYEGVMAAVAALSNDPGLISERFLNVILEPPRRTE